MENSLQQLKGLLQALPRGLQDHLERVRESARALATIHSVPLEAVELAALGHDLARACSAETLLKQAREWHLDVHPIEEQVPILLHGPVAYGDAVTKYESMGAIGHDMPSERRFSWRKVAPPPTTLWLGCFTTSATARSRSAKSPASIAAPGSTAQRYHKQSPMAISPCQSSCGTFPQW